MKHRSPIFKMLSMGAMISAISFAISCTPTKTPIAKETPNSLLFASVKRGDATLLLTALEEGADPNARQKSNLSFYKTKGGFDWKETDQMTPLMIAAARGDTYMLSALLKANASIDAQDVDGRTPLMWASIAEIPENVRFLVEHKAHLHLQDNEGHDAADWAAGNFKILELLGAVGQKRE